MLENRTVTDHNAMERRVDAYEERHKQISDSYASYLELAVLKGQDVPMATWWNAKQEPASEFIGDCSVEARQKLFKACHLVRAGKYEAGAKALLEFIEHVTGEYGVAMADKLAGDEE